MNEVVRQGTHNPVFFYYILTICSFIQVYIVMSMQSQEQMYVPENALEMCLTLRFSSVKDVAREAKCTLASLLNILWFENYYEIVETVNNRAIKRLRTEKEMQVQQARDKTLKICTPPPQKKRL